MGTIKWNVDKLEIDHLELDPRTSDQMIIDMITSQFAPFVCQAVGAEKLSLTIVEDTEDITFLAESYTTGTNTISVGWRLEIEPWNGYHVRIEYRGTEIIL